MLVDTHAHLDYDYEIPVEALVAEAMQAGVTTIITIAASAESLARTEEIAERFPNVFFTSGIHPHDAKDWTPAIAEELEKRAKHKKCVAIGELGLDYYYEHSDRETQFRALEAQLEFSVSVGKPVVIHTRDADEDTKQHLVSHSEAWNARHPGRSPGVLHCFSGGPELARFCLDLGYYISFSGIVTFKNADALRAVAKDIVPLDRLLVETDSPYLAPVPYRGKKNHPAYTRIVAEKVAQLKGLALAELAATTTANAQKLFGF